MRSWHPHNQVIVAKNAHLRHHYETRFDLNLLKEQLNSVGMQAEISEDPGKYLCGFLYYNSLYLSRKIDRLFVLFVHCPSIQSIELKDQVKFIRSLLECLQEQIVTGKVSQSLIEHKH